MVRLMQKAIIIIEADKYIRESLAILLEQGGFDVTSYSSADEFTACTRRPKHSVYLVDWNLPQIDGVAIVRSIRAQDMISPIFILSAYSNQDQIIEGLQAGADDYITKPFNKNELLVRVSNAYRKVSSLQDNLMNIGLKLIPEAHTVVKDGVIVNLTAREFVIFQHLHKNQKGASTREELINQFAKDLAMTARNIDVHVFSLRKKMSKVSIGIETVWGTGYKLFI
jgi:DNA-binding response OmpR family regulator